MLIMSKCEDMTCMLGMFEYYVYYAYVHEDTIKMAYA